jgi:hypothetical protein
MRCMPSYVCTMSQGDCDVLEDIFCHKYHEFISCYWLLKEYSEFISDMKYDDTEKDRLVIDIKLDKLNLDDVLHSLKCESKKKKVTITKRRTIIHMIFYK